LILPSLFVANRSASTGKVKYAALDLSSVGIKKAVTKPPKVEKVTTPVASLVAAPAPPAAADGSNRAAVKSDSYPTRSAAAKPATKERVSNEIRANVAMPPPPPGPLKPAASIPVAVAKSSTAESCTRRTGCVDSVKMAPTGENVAIVSGAFKMEENIRQYIGAAVTMNGSIIGSLVGPFAKLGKCKVNLMEGLEVVAGSSVEILLT
jgi:hypothetical protein